MKTAHHRRARVLWQRAKACSAAVIKKLDAVHGLLTAVATILLVVATYYLASISRNTDVTLHETLVAANRAWVTPVSGFLFEAPAVGKTLAFYVLYGNAGKEPAINFVAQEEYLDSIDPPAPNTSLYTILPKTKLQDICATTRAAKDGGVVYPSGLREYTYKVSTQRPITAEVQSGSKLIVAHGCFAYETFGNEHKSEYCFVFLDAAHNDLAGVHCPSGNAAN